MVDEENVIGFDALYDSMEKCKRGVIWKDSVAHYYLNSIEETLKLERQLKSNTYKPCKPTKMKITSPKPREVLSTAFRDRVYQRSLNDNVVYPAMSRSLIYDNMACQKGKGTDRAIERLKCFLEKMYRVCGTDIPVFQSDITGYYPNMRHDVAFKKFEKHLDEKSFLRCKKVLSEQYEGDVGFNPGSQMVQIAGISALDEFDHYVKERLGIRFYIRYQDDSILLHESKEYLEYCYSDLKVYLAQMGFTFNEKKTRIYSAREGILFLGFHFMVSESGKVYMLLSPQNVKRERLKLRRLVHKAKRGEISKEKVDSSYSGWRAHAEKGDSKKLLKRMDEYYGSLWKE